MSSAARKFEPLMTVDEFLDWDGDGTGLPAPRACSPKRDSRDDAHTHGYDPNQPPRRY